MPDYATILIDINESTMTITLNRPDHLNAFTREMANDLVKAFASAAQNDDVRAIILTGAGRAFCAGADLSEGAASLASGSDETIEAARNYRDSGGLVTLAMFDCSKPVIAAINGAAVGIGLTMTLAADVRYVAEGAKLGFVFLARGIAPDAASSWFLPKIVGVSQAMEWFATARIFGPAEALRAGLVSAVVAPDELLDKANSLAAEIAANTSAVSVAIARRIVWDNLGTAGPLPAHLAESRALFYMARSPDAREGVASFFEKRPPNFPMRVSQDMPGIDE